MSTATRVDTAVKPPPGAERSGLPGRLPALPLSSSPVPTTYVHMADGWAVLVRQGNTAWRAFTRAPESGWSEVYIEGMGLEQAMALFDPRRSKNQARSRVDPGPSRKKRRGGP